MSVRSALHRGIMAFGRSIQAAARRGTSVFSFAAREAQVFAAESIPLPADLPQVLDTGLTWANSLQEAQSAFAGAEPGTLIDSSMISTRFPTINLQEWNTAPRYRAKVLYTYAGDPTEYALWVDNVSPLGMATTEFQAAMRLNLEGMVNNTGPKAGQSPQIAGITGIQIVMDAPPAL